jgi:hypothetical protein
MIPENSGRVDVSFTVSLMGVGAAFRPLPLDAETANH